MDPLVDEYNSKTSTSGKEMAALKLAEDKTKAFVWKFFTAVSLLLAAEATLKLLK